MSAPSTPTAICTLKDRSKDLIISGGSNIYPREVEEVLLKHGRVREVSVIGRPDREWGEVVVAYVVGDAAPPSSTRSAFPHCALQAAEGLCVCRGAAEEQLRQDSQDRAARHGRPAKSPAGDERDQIARRPAAPCPICGKPTDQEFRPFCSKRCADVDLNRWLSGVYAVPVTENDDEDGERPADADESERS